MKNLRFNKQGERMLKKKNYNIKEKQLDFFMEKKSPVKKMNSEDNEIIQQLQEEKELLVKKIEQLELDRKGLNQDALQKAVILSPKEIEKINREIKENTSILNGNETVLESGKAYVVKDSLSNKLDKAPIMSSLKRLHRALATGTPQKLSAIERDRLVNRKAELEKYLSERQKALGHGWDNRDNVEFARTVNNLVKYREECEKYSRELKNINNILEYDNPDVGSLTYLESKKPRNV
jgi:hypothetical protein